MPGFVEEVKDRLVAQGVGVYGTDIFITSAAIIPDGDGPYLLIRDTGGTVPATTQNDTGTQRPTAHISVRAVDSLIALAMAKSAYDALGGVNGLHNIDLSSVFYIRLRVRQEPTDIGMDDTGKRTMFVFNVEAEKYPS